ncbi:MAG: HlyD family efflux transporter periplasmic adaptor subunit, partial [Spirochaetales bacterium]|nr:HlyD family efflux transporter periplasmic adaptor subunit [Spirochaetales bacterium]
MMSGDTPLPILRPDLDIIPGPKAHDGSPTTVVYDPLARSYNRFSWFEFAVIKLLGQPRTLDEVVDLLKQETTMTPVIEEVLSVCQELVREGLTINTLTQQPDQLEKEAKARTPHWFKWLLHHYLYFRIPLLRPDVFLGKTVNFVRPLASVAAFVLYLICGIVGLILVSMRHEQFFHTFQYFFNFKGLLYYGTAITLVKIIHEFSHAYTAKAHGLRVPVMGVAFIVLWPVAYCDVTDAWRIPKQRKRLPVAAAGIIAELVIAGFCFVGWAVTQPGLLNSLFFVVSTASLISTLLVNLNPAMSFDGYYIFMDVSGIDNLRSRAFNYLRWLFRTSCLGMKLVAPEKPKGWRRFLFVTYSIYSWAYRFFLYIGIAVLVYYKFTKLLGIFFFLVEVWWFIALPIVKEISSVIKMRKMLTFNARLISFVLLFVSLAAWLVWPRAHTHYFPAVVEARNLQQIYAPFSGVVTKINGSRGKEVKVGDEILSIASVPLRAEISELSLQEKILDTEAQLLFIQHNFSALPQKEEEKHQVVSNLQGIRKRQELYNISAQVSGVITEWDRNLKIGQHVQQNQVFGRIVNPDDFYFAAYIPEDKVALLAEGETALFYPETGAEAVSGTITKVGKSKTDSIRHIAL